MTPDKRSAWLGFLRTHSLITKALDADLIAAYGFPLSAFEVLFCLGHVGERGLRMTELADLALLSQSRISRLVAELEQRQLLSRRPCDDDSRVVYATITETGRIWLGEAQELHFQGIEQRFFSDLSSTEIAELGRLWSRMITGAGATTDRRCQEQ
jgi:DNA-binding MarR family transcriptional regulator